MTNKQWKILEYLFWRNWTSPTQIGREVGGQGRHSAWASPMCLRMVGEGLLERNEAGHYRLTMEGIETAKNRRERGDEHAGA